MVENIVATIPAPNISVGFAEPYSLLKAITFIGTSCMEDMLIIKKVHIFVLAILLLLFNSLSSFIAFSPTGVAAQPSPKTFAITFDAMYSFAICPLGMLGNNNLIIGLKSLVKDVISPDVLAICIIPIHKDITPNIAIHRETASFEESIIDVLTSSIFPVAMPKIIPIIIISAHK